MNYPCRSLLAVLLLTLAATPLALAVDDEQRVRELIDRTLERIENAVDPLQLRVDPDYGLSADGATYIATFQHFGLDFDGPLLEAGPLIATLTLLDGDEIRIDLQLANTLTVREHDQLLAELGIGEQDLSGAWSEPLQAFRIITMRLEELDLRAFEAPIKGRIAHLSAGQRLDVATDDTWQQRQEFRLDDLRLSIMGSEVRLNRLTSEADIDGRDYPRLRELLDTLNRLVEQTETLDGTPGDAETALETVAALFDTLDGLLDLIAHYGGSLEGSELTVEREGQSVGRLEHFAVNSGMDRRDGLPGLDFSLAIEDFRTPMAPVPPALLPHAARFELRLGNIPEDLLTRFLEIGLASEALEAELRDGYWQQQLMGLLMSSSLELRIPDTFVAAELSRTDFDLRAAVAPESMFGGVGELSLRITNMQQLIDATGAGENPAVAPMLAMITAFAERRELADGQTVDVFELAVTEDGRLMLNNKDITAMFLPGG